MSEEGNMKHEICLKQTGPKKEPREQTEKEREEKLLRKWSVKSRMDEEGTCLGGDG